MYGMKPGKRLLTWIMVFVMTLSMLPLNVLASYPVEPARIIQPDDGTYLTYQFYVGENKVDEQIVKEGETLLAPKTPEAAAGQRFTGWYRGTEKFEDFGKPQGPIAASETIRLDAKFDDVFYVFFVDTQNRIVATREGQGGDTITFADVSFPVQSDESITGWYLEKDFTTKVDSVKLENEDVTLYAKVEKGHWITFDSTGGSYVAPQFVTMGGSTAQPTPNPTRAGFTFDGWLLNGAAFTFGSALDDDIKLTAKWNAKETVSYTVIHWLENADDTEYSYKESVSMTGAAGEQTKATAKSYPHFKVEPITQQTIAGDGSTIVNVKYKRDVYEVKFYEQKGSFFSGYYWEEITAKRITAKYGACIGDQWPGGSWATSAGGSTCQSYIWTMPPNGFNFYDTNQGSAKAEYYLQDLNGNYVLDHTDTGAGRNSTVSKEDQYPITGYTFNNGKSAKIGDRYNGAKFYYDRSSFNVVYMNNGKTEKEQPYKFEASIADAGSYTPSRPEGIDAAYVFTGWYADPAGAQPFVFDGKTMPAQNITVYAHWAAPVHKVTFKVDGQPDQTMTDVAHNATITLPAAPTPPEGEDFLGWVDENGKPFKEDTQITRDLELTAKFGSKTGYTVTYDTTGGNGTPVSDFNHYGKGAAATVLNGADTAPDGKVFLYWEDAAGTKYYPNNTITINGNVKLTAVYGETSQPVAITYHSNFDPDKPVPSNNIPNNGLIDILDYTATGLDKREGYTFTGWNTQSGGNGLAFAAGGQARVDSTAPNDLYAQWTVNQYSYTVEYYYDGKLDSTVTDTADYNSVIDAYPDKIREGYELEKTEGLPLTVGINEAANVIKVYYVKTTVPYTIHHYLNGTTVPVANDMTGRVKVGETQSATVTTEFLPGYEAAEPFLVPAAVTVTADMTVVTLTVYYKMPLTIKADDAAKPYDGSPLTCPTFTVTGLVNGDQAADITLSMTAASTITNAGTQANTIDEATVTGIKEYYKASYQPGTLTITPNTDEITVTITGNNDIKQYTGSEQSVTGFTTDVGSKPITVALKEGKEAIAKGTDVGEYKMGLTEDDFTVTSANYSNIKLNVVDGFLKITPDTNEITVTITGNNDTKQYTGSEQSVTGFTADVGDKPITVALKEGKEATAKGTNVGEYKMGLTEDDFTVTSANYSNIKLNVVDGFLKITPDDSEITVTVTGKNATKQYNGSEQSVTGFTADVGDKPITVALKEGKEAIAKGTDVGEYKMGLTADDFTVTSANYSNITVKVVDGFLEITPNTDEITVTITGNNATKQYTGSEQSVTGFTTDVGSKPITVTLNTAGKDTAKGTDVGEYKMGLTVDDFTVTSANYSNITVVVVDGLLKITPDDSVEINVKIVGKNDSRTYTGLMQKVEGFTYTVNVKGTDVTVALKDGKKAVAEGLSAGTYHMGLTKEFFDVTSKNYSNIKVEVVDGFLVINYTPYVPPTVKIEDDDALGLNTTDHFAYIIGYPDGTVQPNGQITRAEVATIFFRLLTEDVRTANLSRSNRYFDVAASEWYNTAVSTLSSMGIITGYPDGTFRPNAYITRAEFAAIAARFDPSGDKTTASFRDILNHWAKDEISIAYNNSWVDGYPDGTFGPQRNITRAETMTLVNRVLNRRPETEEDLLPEMTIWTDNANPNAWYYLAVQEATNSHYYKFKTNSKYEKWTELRENRDWTQLEK